MNIHYLQHVPFEGPGSIGDWILPGDHTLGVTRLYRDKPLPEVGVDTINRVLHDLLDRLTAGGPGCDTSAGGKST